MSTMGLFPAAMAMYGSDALNPNLICHTFCGEADDTLGFNSFLTRFYECVDANGNRPGFVNSTYLRGYLSDYVLQFMAHLQYITITLTL